MTVYPLAECRFLFAMAIRGFRKFLKTITVNNQFQVPKKNIGVHPYDSMSQSTHVPSRH